MTVLLLMAGLAVAYFTTAAIRRHALASQRLDMPNDRSSHSVPTPRGGGAGIVVAFLLLVAWLAWRGTVAPGFATALIGGGLVVAVVGFIDDLRSIGSRTRLLAHIAAAAWALAWLGGIPPFPVLGATIDAGWFGHALGLLYLVGLLNFFNFMDGIDGIASAEAIGVCLGGALVWWLTTGSSETLAPVAFAFCVAGFLIWNIPPARIFMGDVGSGFIGITVGILSLRAGTDAPQLFWAWFVLVGCFMVDATVTLVRRVRRGERFDEAHRSHAYQYAARRFGAHGPVTLAVLVITTAWLLPIAIAVALRRIDGVAGVAIAYAPLVGLAFYYRAGARELQEG